MRGAIDLTLVVGQLFDLAPERLPVSSGRAGDPAGPGGPAGRPGGAAEWDAAAEKSYRETVYDAMVVALSGRIFLDETVEEDPERVLREIWEDHFVLGPAAAAPG